MSVWTGPGKLNLLAILNLPDKLNSMAFLSMFTPYWPLPLLATFPSMKLLNIGFMKDPKEFRNQSLSLNSSVICRLKCPKLFGKSQLEIL